MSDKYLPLLNTIQDPTEQLAARTIYANKQLVTASDFANLIIAQKNGLPIYLRDVATADIDFSDRNGFTLRNGAPAYYITIARNNDANTVALLDEVNQAIRELNDGALLEAGLMIDLSFDASVHIRNALILVKSNLGLGVLLALGLLWLFMRGWRAALFVGLRPSRYRSLHS